MKNLTLTNMTPPPGVNSACCNSSWVRIMKREEENYIIWFHIIIGNSIYTHLVWFSCWHLLDKTTVPTQIYLIYSWLSWQINVQADNISRAQNYVEAYWKINLVTFVLLHSLFFYFTIIEKACHSWGTIGQCSGNNRSWLHEWFQLLYSDLGQCNLFELRKHVCEDFLCW